MHICMIHILKCEKPQSPYILRNLRTDNPIPISNYNQLGLYKVGMYILRFCKWQYWGEISILSFHIWNVCPQFLYITGLQILQYTNKISNPIQLECLTDTCSKRQIVILVLYILLCNKKSLKQNDPCAKNRIRNKEMKPIKWVINWNFQNTQKCMEEIQNRNCNVK